MARVETDPNYTAPTFSRATAGTDLFRKEDVQQLAAALSTHDHSTGKGLVLPAGAIPNGTITTAHIADGQITTAKIATTAVQEALGQYAGGPTFSTTSTLAWVVTPITVNITTAGGLLRIEVQSAASHSAVGGYWNYGIGASGAPTLALGVAMSAITNQIIPMPLTLYTALAAGNHTIALWVNNATAGTLTLSNSITHTLWVTEQKR